MKKVLTVSKAIKLAKKLREEGKSIVLVGGVFDILHIGHIKFLEKAKEKGDVLFVLLESDEATRKMKEKNRPINTQKIRAQVLSSLEFVDCVVMLTEMKNNADYDKLVTRLRPMVIAITKNDKSLKHKERQAKLIGAKILSVISLIPNQSTSKLANIIEEENNL